jgi:hypothetical protein
MNLATMRTKFQAHTSGLADALASSAIDDYLNLFHQWVVPADVDGSIGEYVWEWDYFLANTTNYITIPYGIVAESKPKTWINNPYLTNDPARLTVMFDFVEFLFRFPDYESAANRKKPDTVCFLNNRLYFNTRGDLNYTGGMTVRSGPVALTSEGIGDDILANLVVAGSAWVYLLEKEDTMGAAREGGLYDIYKQLILTRSGSRYQPRRDTRSF